MGGSLTFGNVTPAAEFNIWCDPDAAHVVFTSGIPIQMIGLNVTRQVLAVRPRRDQIRAMGKTTTTHVADMLDFYAHGEGQYSGLRRRRDARPAGRGRARRSGASSRSNRCTSRWS